MKYHYDSNAKSAHLVTENTSVISVMRNMKIKHPESVYLLIEGVKDDKAVIYKYEIIRDENRIGRAAVKIEETSGTEEEIKEWYKRIVLRNNTERNGENIIALTWDITSEQAEALQTSIQIDKDKENTDRQMRYEKGEIVTQKRWSCGLSTREYVGYDWIRNKLKDLKDSRVTLPAEYKDFMDIITRNIRR